MRRFSPALTSDPKLFGLCRETGLRVDDVLLDMTAALLADNYQLAGFVQRSASSDAADAGGILLHDLMSGHVHDVSDRRGAGASGCSLDWGALSELAGALEHRLKHVTPALVVINRFGKAEAEGRGFCAVIEGCLDRDIPVLVAYRAGYKEPWTRYHGGYACEILGKDRHAVMSELGFPTPGKATS